jgi:organic hydroperoxide reductase OsmC/OhrA
MSRNHAYLVTTEWTGNLGEGTANYRSFSRNHEITGSGKAAPIAGSSDPSFRGDPSRYNPEELLVASLSACHMLWLLHLCAETHLVVLAYTDNASGMMVEHQDGSGEFTEVTLRPRVTLADASRWEELEALHHRAHELCFISRSVKFPVHVEPVRAEPANPQQTSR